MCQPPMSGPGGSQGRCEQKLTTKPSEKKGSAARPAPSSSSTASNAREAWVRMGQRFQQGRCVRPCSQVASSVYSAE